MEIKDIVMSENPDISESIIDIAILRAETMVREYCNLDTVPEALELTVADIASDIISNKYSSDDSDNVKSIQQGDTTIQFNTSNKKNPSDITKSYISELNKYRRLRR